VGFLLPTLDSLHTKLKLLRPTVKLADPLDDTTLAGFVTRFVGYSEREDLILASITLPQFRLRWLDEVNKKLS